MTTQSIEIRKILKYAPRSNVEGDAYYAINPKNFEKLKELAERESAIREAVSSSFMLGRQDRVYHMVRCSLFSGLEG